MSDREMLAYAIIAIAVVIYGAAIARWRYMSPKRRMERQEREGRARYDARRAEAAATRAKVEPDD